MATEIMMDGEITMRRGQQTAAMVMDALQIGRYRAASVSPTRAPSVVDGTPGTVVRRITRYKAASVSRILDHVSQRAVFQFDRFVLSLFVIAPAAWRYWPRSFAPFLKLVERHCQRIVGICS
jgi:hypothetical protein